MPDKHGFNHLGDDVRCIDCPTGGPLGRWPEHKRAQHARTHGPSTTAGARDLRRRRPLLTAPPTASNEEKEATMPTTAPKEGASAKQVAIDVLREAGEPLHASEIAKRVLATGRCAGLKGKTPEATISALLAVGSKPGGSFSRVDKGTYTLAETAAATATASEPAAAATTRSRADNTGEAQKTSGARQSKKRGSGRSR